MTKSKAMEEFSSKMQINLISIKMHDSKCSHTSKALCSLQEKHYMMSDYQGSFRMSRKKTM